MKIGDKIIIKKEAFFEKERITVEGEVCYIHPNLRYYTIKYKSGVTESFYFYDGGVK